jgi:hypothetical protein
VRKALPDGKLNGEETMALRKFRSFIGDHQRPLSLHADRSNLKEATDVVDITDASTAIIGSDLLTSERQSLTDSFINDVTRMTKDGRSILAIAVAFE